MLRIILAFITAIPCTILLLPVLGMGLVLRLFRFGVHVIASAIEPAFVPWPELMRYDPVLGWKPRPNLDAHYLADRDDVFHLVTDADGWPGRCSIEESQTIIIGDSFVFGYGMTASKSFTARDPSLRAKALGAPGYSMVHGLLLMQQLGERLRGKTVVWCIFLENDFPDSLMPNLLHYRTPFLKRNGGMDSWEIVSDHLSPEPWESSEFRRRHPVFGRLHAHNAISEHVFSACEYLIKRAAETCSAVGARLAVMTIPHPVSVDPARRDELRQMSGSQSMLDFDPELPNRRVEEFCRSHGIDFMSGQSFLRASDYKSHEGIHWNEEGHRSVAKHLEEFCRSMKGNAPSVVISPGAR